MTALFSVLFSEFSNENFAIVLVSIFNRFGLVYKTTIVSGDSARGN